MINKKDVENIAFLARLEIEENEIEKYQAEISKILSFVEKINELDLKNVAPTSHILNIENISREDETKSSYSQEVILQNTEYQKDGFIIVPKVI